MQYARQQAYNLKFPFLIHDLSERYYPSCITLELFWRSSRFIMVQN